MARKRRTKGEGSIFESPAGSGIWYAQITLDDGKQIKRKGPSQKQAREQLKELNKLKEQQVDLGAKQPSLWEWWQLWLDEFAPKLKPQIYDDYLSIGRTHVSTHRIGKKKLIDLTFGDVQGWVNQLAKKLAPRTVRNAHSCLRRALKVAMLKGYIGRNVAVGIDLPSPGEVDKDDFKVNPLTFDQATAFLESVADSRYHALYQLAIGIGARQGELLGLTWDCVDLDKGTVTFRQNLVRGRPRGEKGTPLRWMLLPPKTASAERTITLGDDLRAVLRAHKATQAAERLKGGAEWRERDPFRNRGGLVFTTDEGRPVHSSVLLTNLRRALARLSLPAIRFHDLRHTCASLMIDLKYQIVAISKILGHANPGITMKIYAHALEDSMAEAVAGLSARLRRG